MAVKRWHRGPLSFMGCEIKREATGDALICQSAERFMGGFRPFNDEAGVQLRVARGQRDVLERMKPASKPFVCFFVLALAV